MIRRTLLPVLLGTALLGAAPALADGNGSTEKKNDVKCGKTNQVASNPSGVSLYASQGSGLGVCSDGSGPASTLQGRVSVSGSQSQGLKVVVDGDKDNTQHSSAQGWAMLEVKPGSAPSYRCGDEKGSMDSDKPTKNDGPEDCG